MKTSLIALTLLGLAASAPALEADRSVERSIERDIARDIDRHVQLALADPALGFAGRELEAERVVTAAIPHATIVRMAGFFGGEAADKNFVGRIIPAMRAAIDRGETRFAVGDRVWQPTWTRDLAVNTLHLVNRGVSGSVQMACRGEASFAEIAAEIVMALGWQDRLAIDPVSAAAVSGNELGRRPDRAVLSCERLDAEGLNLQRDWRATLHAYLDHPFFDRYRLEPAR